MRVCESAKVVLCTEAREQGCGGRHVQVPQVIRANWNARLTLEKFQSVRVSLFVEPMS